MENLSVPNSDSSGVVMAWKRNLDYLRQNKQRFKKLGILDHETTLVHYLSIVEQIEIERVKGNVCLQVCPSYNAWEGKCQEPQSIVSNWCVRHAALYDHGQIFFTSCNQCKEIKQKSPPNRTIENVAFYYHQKGNLCFGHQMKLIGNRKRPPKRRQSGLVLEIVEKQRKCIPEIVGQYVMRNCTHDWTAQPVCDVDPQLLRFLEEMTPPVTPDLMLLPPDRPYYQDPALDLNVEEVVLDVPLPQEEIKAVMDDIFDDDDSLDGCDDFMAVDQLPHDYDSQDSLTSHVDWTLQVLDEMEWRDLTESEASR